MQKMKRGLAVTLAATMVMGSSLTIFAAENSGSTTGTGTSEGHVDKHVINVELPTIAEGSTPFAYTMDAERLIQETEGAKYSNATFPAEASDTGVYFLTGKTEATTAYKKLDTAPDSYTGGDFESLAASLTQEQYDALDDTNGEKNCYQSEAVPAGVTYDNTSEALKVTSKSSAAVKLTVEVEVASEDTDIALVDTAPAADVTDPQLYLALNVGSTTKAIKAGETTTAEVTIAGKDENFVTTVDDNNAYVYAEKEVAEGDPELTWNEESISLTGAVSKTSAKDLTAPELTVTWKYEDPAATPAGPQVTMTEDGVITMSGLTAEANYAHSAVLVYGDLSDELDSDPNMEWGLDNWTEEDGGTLVFSLSQAWLSALEGKEATVTVHLTNNTTIDATCQF